MLTSVAWQDVRMSGRRPATSIAIIGMAARFPEADDVEAYWTTLVNAVESISRGTNAAAATGAVSVGAGFVPAVARVRNIDLFDADYFRIPPAEAVIMDPQHRVLLEVAVTALEDAGYHAVADKTIGVFVGCGENYYLRDFVLPHERRDNPAANAEHLKANGTDTRILAANEKDFLAARIAFKLGLTGPSVTVQATCATSLTAVALACTALAAGDCDIALAGGVSLLMPDMAGYVYSSGGILSADGRCRPFDAGASGTVPGSGAALVVLRRDDDATADRDHRRAVIRGWAINNDGGSRAGFTAPSATGQQAVIQAALAHAGVAADDVGYVETHGTATPIGDPVEFESLRRVFATGTRSGECVLGAVKSNIGHADAAAGIAGLIKAALAAERATIPATLHFESPNPEVDLAGSPFTVRSETRPWTGGAPRVAGVSAFGLGGNNAHVVLQAADSRPPAGSARPGQAIVLSARTEAELRELRSAMAGRLRRRSDLSRAELADVAFTLAVGRPHFEYRWSTCVSDGAELLARLALPATPPRPALRWSLSIHGTYQQIAVAGRRLAADEPLVRAALTELGAVAVAGEQAGDEESDLRLAALTALSITRVLSRLGLTFARIDMPRWAAPVQAFVSGGADAGLLDQALHDCTPDGDVGDARAGTGRILAGPAFDLGETIGFAWARSALVDWSGYFAVEERGRVPLPSYPFSRRRHWLPRIAPHAPEPTRQAGPEPATRTTDVRRTVEAVWRDVLGLDAIDHEAHFVDDLAGDSMYAVEIGARLREILHVEVPLDLPYVAPTIDSATHYIESHLLGSATDQKPADN